jgi:hypothetical protein
MTDTPTEIRAKQLGILLSKTEAERFRIGDELNDFGRKVIGSLIRQEQPGISEKDLKINVFKRCYSALFTPDELEKIIRSMRDYFT